MKKQSKVYSTSDFVSMSTSIIVDDCFWEIDTIAPTNVGEYSKTPLFEVGLKRIKQGVTADLPSEYEDGTSLMSRNRKHFVREDRPLYTQLAEVWNATDGDIEIFSHAAMQAIGKKAFRGHVERLSGIKYSKGTRNGIVIKSRMELWYPDEYEEGTIIDDFITLCNRGVYKPIFDEPNQNDILKTVDPSIVAAVMAALGKK